jgi:hypothetical protein
MEPAATAARASAAQKQADARNGVLAETIGGLDNIFERPAFNSAVGAVNINELSRSKGVICPPAGVDPSIAVPPTGGGVMPVIPPPGTPGGDPHIVPK